jgi:hypothetical protein
MRSFNDVCTCLIYASKDRYFKYKQKVVLFYETYKINIFLHVNGTLLFRKYERIAVIRGGGGGKGTAHNISVYSGTTYNEQGHLGT